MILTCPSCGTQYAVKDGAIPAGGRQVRCASCKHAWHQDPERDPDPADDGDSEATVDAGQDESIAAAAMIEPRAGPEAEERAYLEASLANGDDEGDDGGEALSGGTEAESATYAAPVDPVAPPGEPLVEEVPAMPVETQEPIEQQVPEQGPADGQWSPPAGPEPDMPTDDEDDFRPFTMEEHEEPRRGPLRTVLFIVLLIAVLAAAFWFLAPAEWKERVGIAASGETPLQLMMTHSDRQKLESGNELLAVSGRVINPTDEEQNVPPIRAQLRSTSGKLVYSWTIPPPARILPPGASKTFNSAEVNVPSGGDELTITLGPNET